MADGWAIGLTVAIVVLAGCAGLFGTSEPTTTPTPTTAGPTASATASPSPTPADTPTPGIDAKLPAGVSADGIDNVSALLAAHAEAVTATGYVISGNGSTTVRRQGFYVGVETRQRNLVAENASTYTTRRTVDAGPYDRTRVAWANASVQFERIVTNGEEKFERGPPKSTDKLAGRGLLEPYLRGGNYTLVETEEAAGGQRFTLEATGIDNRTAVFEALPDPAEEITGFEATVVVDSRGRIHAVEVTVGYVMGDREEDQQLVYTLQQTGNVTVTEPDWMGAARNTTSDG